MKKLAFIGIILISIVSSCGEKKCPNNMEECTLQDGTTVCVPKGKC